MKEFMADFGGSHEAVMTKGHCLTWSANLVHGGPPAKTEKTKRHSQVTHYFFHGSNCNWFPVASNLHKGQVEYYSPESIAKKWDEKVPKAERKEISKLFGGDCETHSGVVSPCDMQSRPPLVMSKLYEYVQKEGEVVM